jgi:Restriction endonuclease
MQGFIVDGIKYQKIGDQAFYAQELFESEELIGYLNKNMLEAEKSVYDHVIYDSETVEAELAQAFEKNEQVKVYAKLPSWFKVDTPLGSYNPDWAVLFDIDGQERLYFVVESKETHIEELLRKEAQGKIKCGRAHFEALGADTNYVVASNMDTLMDQVTAKLGQKG